VRVDLDKSKGKKFTLAYDEIWRIINDDLEEGQLLPSETEIARKLSLNRLTVSKALNTLASEGYLFRKAGMGTKLLHKPSNHKTGFILVISGAPAVISGGSGKPDFFFPLYTSIQRTSMELELPVLWAPCRAISSNSFEISKIQSLYNPRLTTGIIVTNAFISDQNRLLPFLQNVSCPVVWALASASDNIPGNCVDIDNCKAARDLVNVLIERGITDIACFSREPDTVARRERIDGYCEALRENGLPVRDEFILKVDYGRLQDIGRDCTALMVSRKIPAQGIFCTDKEILDGVKVFCDDFGSATIAGLPKVTFDAMPGSVPGQVAGIIQPLEKIGHKAVHLINDIIAANKNSESNYILPYKLEIDPAFGV